MGKALMAELPIFQVVFYTPKPFQNLRAVSNVTVSMVTTFSIFNGHTFL